MEKKASIVFIGAGKLAHHLAPALYRQGYPVVGVWSRTLEHAQDLAQRLGKSTKATNDWSQIPTAEIYFYAVTDTVLPELGARALAPQAIHLHTAGSMGLEVLVHKPNRGVFYPFQSFSEGGETDFEKVPILLESDSESVLQTMQSLAHSLSQQVFVASQSERQRLHLAGVLANNFVNALYQMAEQECQKAGLPFEILLPLIEQTAHKLHTLTPKQAQTGPAIRHDHEVMQRHEQLLQDEPLTQQIYTLFSQYIENHET